MRHSIYLIKKSLAALLLVFSLHSSPSLATVSCNAKSCTGAVKDIITAVLPADGDSGIVLLTSTLLINELMCVGRNGGPNIELRESHALFEETYALLLMAIANNSKVTVRIGDQAIATNSTCEVFYIRLEI